MKINTHNVDFKIHKMFNYLISRTLVQYEKELRSLTNEIPTAACGRPKRSWLWDWMNAQPCDSGLPLTTSATLMWTAMKEAKRGEHTVVGLIAESRCTGHPITKTNYRRQI